MAFTPLAGKNGLIYVSGTELPGANAWSIAIESDAVEYSKFGDTWKSNFVGLKGWSGSIGALSDSAAKTLQDAATATIVVALLIYPDRTDGSTYYSGNAIFSFSSEASMDAAVGQSADFTGTGALTPTGWS
jgi:hypothetical protein